MLLNNKWPVISIILMLIVSSCQRDFLDVPDNSYPIRQEYVKDLKTLGDYLNGIYVEIGSKFYHGYNLIYPELISDNIKPVVGASVLQNHYRWVQKADDKNDLLLSQEAINVNPIWFNGYRIIRDCNFVLENIDRYRQQNQVKANDIKGQAYAIRALMHSVLVNIFAQSYNYTPGATHSGIPYITTSSWSDPVSRNTVAEVYSQMITDLREAHQLLPPIPTTVDASNKNFVISINAVKALLAKVYLFKGEYGLAKNFSRDVLLHVPIMAQPDYPAKLFTKQETEALFQLPPSWQGALEGAGTYYTYFAGLYFAPPLRQFTAADGIAAILKADPLDVRSNWVIQEDGGWTIAKYPKDVITGFPAGTLAYYQTIIRSSEMSLIAAESYARLNNEDSARFFLNEIRMRGNASTNPVIVSGPPLLDSIYKERRKELAFEGGRMFDLQRWKKEVLRSDGADPAFSKLPYPDNRAIAPIPLSDVNISGLAQNPNY